MKEGRGTGRVGPAVSWGGSGLSSPSSPPGQRRHWRAAAAFPFVSPTPLLSLSLHPTLVFQHPSVILCFSSLLLRPPPPLAPKLSPSSHKQSALPLPPLLPPLSLSPFFPPSSRRVSLWGRPRPPSPAPPGLLMPRPLGRASARLRIPDPGQAGLGLLHHLACKGIFCTALSPRALSENAGVLAVMKARDPLFHPLLLLPATQAPGMLPAGVCPAGSQPRGGVPSGAAPKGATKVIKVRAQLREVQGAFPRVSSWRGPTLEGYMKLQLGGGAASKGVQPGGMLPFRGASQRISARRDEAEGLHPRGEHLEGSQGSSPQGAHL